MPTFQEMLYYLFNGAADLNKLHFNTDWYGTGVWGLDMHLASDYELAIDDANHSLTKEQALIEFEKKCFEPILEYYFSVIESRDYA